MAKIERIIEYRPNVQRTPLEAAEAFKDDIEKYNVKECVIIYNTGDHLCYIPGSKERDFNKAQINWMVDQFKRHFLCDNFAEEED